MTTGQDPSDRRRTRALLGWAVLVLGLAGLRVVFVLATRHDAVFRVPYLDGAFYHVWARSLAEGRGDFLGPYFLGPLYPYFVSLLYRLFEVSPEVVRWAQTLLGCIDLALVAYLGARLGGALVGVVATLLLGLYGPLVFYEGLLLMESLLVTLGLLALAVTMTHRPVPVHRAALAGAALGLGSLGRGSMLLPALPLGVWVARGPGAPGARRRALVALLGATFLVTAPVCIRNVRQGDGFVPATNAGVNFRAGNGPGARGRFRPPDGVRFFSAPVLDPGTATAASLPAAVAERALTVEAVAGTAQAADSRHWFAEATRWMARHPGPAVALWARKIWLTLQAREVAQLEDYAFHRQRLGALALFPVSFGWIMPLAGAGLVWGWRRRHPSIALLAGYAAALLVTCVVFFVTARYRLASVPALCLLAGWGVRALIGGARRRNRAAAWTWATALALVVLAHTGPPPPATAAGWQHAQMAERVYALGDLDGAIAYQEAAARALPNRTEILINLALYWSERGHPSDLERAAGMLGALLQRRPDDALLHFNLGTVLERAGRRDDAVRHYRQALRLDPGFTPAAGALRRLQGPPPGPR